MATTSGPSYHEYWKLQDTKENFFQWLDYSEGKKVNLKEVPRETLEREKVRYLSLEERQAYLVKVDEVCGHLFIRRYNIDGSKGWPFLLGQERPANRHHSRIFGQ